MSSAILSALAPLFSIVLGAITSILVHFLTQSAKSLSTKLDASPAYVKQGTALAISILLSVLTALAGVHLTGTSLSTLTPDDFSVLVQALVGWIGAMVLHNSAALAKLGGAGTLVADVVQGFVPVAPPAPVVVNVHTAPAPAPVTIQQPAPVTGTPEVGAALATAVAESVASPALPQ